MATNIPKHILVVDDDSTICKLLVLILSAEGYTVDAVETAEEALRKLQKHVPDLAILDVALPKMDGFTLC